MRHTGLLRIDHVMGLHRLYWIPARLPADQGTYVGYPAEELYAILCLESQRHKTVLVGENLGTVPPEVTEAMGRHQLRETYVAQYSHKRDARRPLAIPPSHSVAMLNTHDMPMFASHWQGADIRQRSRRGLLSKAEARRTAQERRKHFSALLEFLRRGKWLRSDQADAKTVARAVLGWLAAGRAETLLISLEDLWGESRPQNVPGLVLRENWRRKTRWSLEDIERSAELRDFLRYIDQLRKLAQEAGPEAMTVAG